MDHDNLTDAEVDRIETVETVLARAAYLDLGPLTASVIARAARCSTTEAHAAAGYLVAQHYATRTADNAHGRYVASESVAHRYAEDRRRQQNRADYAAARLA